MRILLAVDAPSSHLFPLPQGWADRGHEVTIVMDRPDGRFGTAAQFSRPRVDLLTGSWDGRFVDACGDSGSRTTLRALLDDADRVVIGGYATRIARRILAVPRTRRPPTLLMAERPDPRTRGWRRRARDLWIGRVLRAVDGVWSMSAAGDAAFEALGRRPSCRVPYPIDLPSNSDDTSRRWLEPLRPRILVIGKLIERKRPLLALEAIRALHESGVDAESVMVGSGNLDAAVHSAAADLPVEVVGSVPRGDVERLMRSSHVLLHPAAHDGWGMVVAEAAAHGLPVVATSECDAASELAGPSLGGVRLAPAGSDALSATIRSVLDDFVARPVERTAALRDAVRRVCGTEAVVLRSLTSLASVSPRP